MERLMVVYAWALMALGCTVAIVALMGLLG